MEGQKSYSLFDVFNENEKENIIFVPIEMEKVKAVSSFDYGSGKKLLMFSSCLRQKEPNAVEEREYFAFLHKEEADAKLRATQYSLKDLSNDFRVGGVIVFLCKGGYFHAAFFEGNLNCTKHKGFRRYVNRRGQGKRQTKHQSANGKKSNRSAGGQLRAFNEVKHEQEIKELITEWDNLGLFERCSRIFIDTPKGIE